MNKVLLTLVVSVLASAPAQAGVIGFEFRVDIDSGALAGETFTGSFSYDEAEVTGIADEFVDLSSFDFNFQGLSFGLNDAVAEAAFFDGDFLGLSYSIDFPAPVSFSFTPGFFEIGEAFFAYENPNGDGTGSLAFTPARASVPEPSTLLLLVIGLAALFLTRIRMRPGDDGPPTSAT